MNIKKYQKHMSVFGTECNIFDMQLREFDSEKNMFCSRCPSGCDFKNTHLYGCFEALRWDNKYVYYCSCGFIFIAVPIFDDNNIPVKGIVAGPIVMGDKEDFDETYDLPNYSADDVNNICEIMAAVFSSDKKEDSSTEELLNDIYKELDARVYDSAYPIQLEKELQTSIIERNSAEARELLNRLLGQIFFCSNADINIIKVRILELIVLLSRSAIDGGADVNRIFGLNNSYIKDMDKFCTIEQISQWLTSVINRFIGYVFEFSDVKHTDAVYKITAYVKDNYMNKITLDDIAANVYLSKSYISKIFKEEMGMSLTSYINDVRIKKSKHLLLLDSSLTLADVANLVGFPDQSYFTNTFKKVLGVSPGRYREKHGKI